MLILALLKTRVGGVILVQSPPSNYGALAQLGERNTGSVEVSGSIPLGSTIFSIFSDSVTVTIRLRVKISQA